VAPVLPHPAGQAVPHPTTLSKLVRRAGPEVIGQLNTALLGKLAADRVLRSRKLRIDTTVIEADIDHPTDADLLEQAVRTTGGLVRRLKARGMASRTRFRDRSRSAGRRMRQLAQTLRRRTGVAMARSTGSPPRSPASRVKRCVRSPRCSAAPTARWRVGDETAGRGGWPASSTRPCS
jgi:hypothetical protein